MIDLLQYKDIFASIVAAVLVHSCTVCVMEYFVGR